MSTHCTYPTRLSLSTLIFYFPNFIYRFCFLHIDPSLSTLIYLFQFSNSALFNTRRTLFSQHWFLCLFAVLLVDFFFYCLTYSCIWKFSFISVWPLFTLRRRIWQLNGHSSLPLHREWGRRTAIPRPPLRQATPKWGKRDDIGSTLKLLCMIASTRTVRPAIIFFPSASQGEISCAQVCFQQVMRVYWNVVRENYFWYMA